MTRHRATYEYCNDSGEEITIDAAVPKGGNAEIECNCELIRVFNTAWVDYKLVSVEAVQ